MVKVDPGNTGRVGPTEAALFLKKSGLPDMTLGKVSVCCLWLGADVQAAAVLPRLQHHSQKRIDAVGVQNSAEIIA